MALEATADDGPFTGDETDNDGPETGAEGASAGPEAVADQADAETSRRARSRQTIAKMQEKFATFEADARKRDEDYRRELAVRDSRIAEMGGFLQGMAQQRQQPQTPQKSAEDLEAEADAALEKNDYKGWKQKTFEAWRMKTIADMPRQQPQQQYAPQADPITTSIMVQHMPEGADPQRYQQLAIIEDARLNALGHAPNHDRYRKAFQLASQALTQRPGAPTYSQSMASALSGSPSRGSAGASTDAGGGDDLNEADRAWMKAANMTEKEFKALRTPKK